MDTSGKGYGKSKVITLSQEQHKTKTPIEVNFPDSRRSFVWRNVSANTMDSKKGLQQWDATEKKR